MKSSLQIDKEQDQPKLSPIPKFHVAEKAQIQPKLSKTPKFPVSDKVRDFQPKLSPTSNFLWPTKPLLDHLRSFGRETNTEHISMGKCKPTMLFWFIIVAANHGILG